MVFKYCAFFLLLHVSVTINAQFTQGPRSPSTTGNMGSGSYDWSGAGNVKVSDNVYATASVPLLALLGQDSHFLTATGFGFSLPADAVITGIRVDMEKDANGFPTTIVEKTVRLMKGGAIVGTNTAVAGFWPTSKTNFTHGSATNLWGTTWTPDDINASNFGVAISVNMGLISLAPSARIDHIKITVDYTSLSQPIHLLHFAAKRQSPEQVLLNWNTEWELNNDYFTVECSADGVV